MWKLIKQLKGLKLARCVNSICYIFRAVSVQVPARMTLCGQKAVILFAVQVLTTERHAFTPSGSHSSEHHAPLQCFVPVIPPSQCLAARRCTLLQVHSISRALLSSMWVEARLYSGSRSGSGGSEYYGGIGGTASDTSHGHWPSSFITQYLAVNDYGTVTSCNFPKRDVRGGAVR